jgi:hypothetical protein
MTAAVATERDRAGEILASLVALFESGNLPKAIAATRLIRQRNDRPCAEWSLTNQLCVYLAGSDDARGFRQWKDVGRQVKKGAKAVYILGPVKRKRRVTDELTGEEVERVIVVGFKAIPVFKVEDTEGEPVVYADYNPDELPPLADVAERLGVPVRYAPTPSGERGHYALVDREIVLGTHDVDTFFHELAHAAHASFEKLQGGQNPRQEIIAETTAAVLCQLYGYSGYVAEAYDYVGFYAGEDKPEKAVGAVLADVERVLDVILGREDK